LPEDFRRINRSFNIDLSRLSDTVPDSGKQRVNAAWVVKNARFAVLIKFQQVERRAVVIKRTGAPEIPCFVFIAMTIKRGVRNVYARIP